jgi:hypothetical protein
VKREAKSPRAIKLANNGSKGHNKRKWGQLKPLPQNDKERSVSKKITNQKGEVGPIQGQMFH